jgi:hypothetical protein
MKLTDNYNSIASGLSEAYTKLIDEYLINNSA